jgi:integrase
VWTIPKDETKGNRTHEVPLSPLAMEVLTTLPRFADNYVFSTTGGAKPISGYSKIKNRADKLVGVEDWRLHDLRRTLGTGLASLGIPVSTISRVLNHKEGGVTKIYNRYGYMSEKRIALETWARKIESLIRPTPDNVVELRLTGGQ